MLYWLILELSWKSKITRSYRPLLRSLAGIQRSFPMSRSSWKAMLPFTFLFMLLLAACGSSGATQTSLPSTPTPAPAQGQELLTKAGQNLKTAKTLHAIFDINTAGSAANGTVSTEVWNVSPDKSH